MFVRRCFNTRQHLFTKRNYFHSPTNTKLSTSKDIIFTPQASLLTSPITNVQDATYNSDSGVIGVMEACGSWSSELPSSFTQKTLNKMCNQIKENPSVSLAKSVDNVLSKEAPVAQPKFCIVQRKEENKIRAITLGDTGFLVLRHGKIIFRSKRESVLYDTLPFTIKDPRFLSRAIQTELSLLDDDLIIVGSDGLFDNLFFEDIEDIVHKSEKTQIAQNLATSALATGYSKRKITPFSERVNAETDQIWRGGKPDDVAVVVC